MNFPIQLLLMLCINIMLVLGGIFDEAALYDTSSQGLDNAKSEGNILPAFFQFTNGTTGRAEVTDFNQNISDEFSGITSAGGVNVGAFQGFTDAIALVRSIGSFLVDVVTAPFQLLFNPNLQLPYEFRMMFGLPYSLLYVFAFIRWFRTGD